MLKSSNQETGRGEWGVSRSKRLLCLVMVIAMLAVTPVFAYADTVQIDDWIAKADPSGNVEPPTQIDISTCTIDSIADQTYTGKAITPAVTVKNGSAVLNPTSDYTVSYTNNTNVGTATVTVAGKGGYKGTKAAQFKIVAKTEAPAPVNISTCTIASIADQGYTGKAIKPAIKIKNGGAALKQGTDYTVSYVKNKNIGTASVKITGKGNYTGTKTISFKIVPKKPASLKVNSKKSKTIAVSFKKAKGATNYQITYSMNKNFKKGNKSITTKNASATIKKLKAKKTYYVKVRAYKSVNGKKFYSAYTAAKKVTVKR